jgi:MFS family permease
MVVLDITVVTVALPSIGDDLDLAPADLSWVVNAYTVALGGFLLLGGRRTSSADAECFSWAWVCSRWVRSAVGLRPPADH